MYFGAKICLPCNRLQFFLAISTNVCAILEWNHLQVIKIWERYPVRR